MEIIGNKGCPFIVSSFTLFCFVLFQGEGNSNENFFLRLVKLVLNIIAVLVLAGVISVVIKVFNYYHNNDF